MVSSNNRVVLLAEDNRDDADFFRRAFRAAGFEQPFHTVNNGQEALSYLSGEGQYADRARYPLPYLVVLDANMPGTSGWQVLDWVRRRPEFGALVVIIFSGDGPIDEDLAARLGANGYHRKPPSLEELQALVKKIG